MTKKMTRPWGYYETISEASNYHVKKIVVEPERRLSLQSHKLRNEHWFIVSGRGQALVGDKSVLLETGSAIDIPKQTRHRVQSFSGENLVIIEVQTGEYFGEDDIERYEDDYGRI